MSDLWRESDESELPPGEENEALAELAALAALVARVKRENGWYTIQEVMAQTGLTRDVAYGRMRKRLESGEVEARQVWIDGRTRTVYRVVKHE